MKLLKRSLALLLSLILCLGFITLSAFADGPVDTETSVATEQNDSDQPSSEAEKPGTGAVETADGGESSTSEGEPSQEGDTDSEGSSAEITSSNTEESESHSESTETAVQTEDKEPMASDPQKSDNTDPSDETQADEQLPVEGQSESLETENDSSDAASTDEPLVEEKQPEPLTLSVAKLKDVQIKNGAAVFVVQASCNQEDVLITYQWQKLDTKGAFNEIEDKNERALAREAAWENIDRETKASFSFKDIEDYSKFENLLFRCRVTAGDVAVYSDEVKLLPEIVPDEQGRAVEPEPAADVPSEDDPDEADPVAEEIDEAEPVEDESTETEPAEEAPNEGETPAEEPSSEDESQEPSEENHATEDEPQEPGDETEPDVEEELQEEDEAIELVLTEEYVWDGDLEIEEGAVARISGAVTVPEEATLTVAGTLIIEEEASLAVAGKLILAETAMVEGDVLAITAAEAGVIEGLERFLPMEEEPLEIVLTEDYLWNGDLEIEEGSPIRVSGAVTVPEGVTLTVAGTLIIEEEASLTVAGKLVLAETATVEGDVLAITAAETGEIEGLERFLPEVPELTWEDILAAGIFESEEPVTVADAVTIPTNAILVIHGGELIFAPEATLTVEGLLIIDGGTLTVSEGAALNNEMFIQVEGNGVLQMEGVYEQAEVAALVWNAVDNASSVEGVSRSLIDKTVSAVDAQALNDALSRDGYRTLTILLTNAELAKTIDHVPNGVIISVR